MLRVLTILFALSMALWISAPGVRASVPHQPSPSHPWLALKAQPRPIDMDVAELVAMTPGGETQPPAMAADANLTPEQNNPYWVYAYQALHYEQWEILFSQTNDPLRILFEHPAADTWPALDGMATRIAFVSDRDGNAEIYTGLIDDTGLTRLTNSEAVDTMPKWSPDDKQILYVSEQDGNAEIYLMAADGSNQRRLTDDPAQDYYPAWSPDGQNIVWVRVTNNERQLWVMKTDGSEAHAITGHLQYLQHPAWSPDGAWIAFDYDADGDSFNEIALIRPDGTGLQAALDYSHDGYYQELWVNEWLPQGNLLSISQIHFRLEYHGVNNPVLVFDTFYSSIAMLNPEPGTLELAYSLNSAYQTHLRYSISLSDPLPPSSQVEPLPRYSRAAGFEFSWRGEDLGSSGIEWYEIQIRSDTDSQWRDFITNTPHTTYPLPDQMGHEYPLPEKAQTIYLRSRAIDRAGNVEAWPEHDYDTMTTLFATQHTGRVIDARGVPRYDQPISVMPAALEPVRTGYDGRYLVRVSGMGEYQVNGARLFTDIDNERDFYLKPAVNLIKNGSFEEGPMWTGWQRSTSLSNTVTSYQGYIGGYSAPLGSLCANLCLTEPISPTMPGQLSADADQAIYFLWQDGANLFRRYRPVDGENHWTEDSVIVPEQFRLGQVLLDPAKTLHIIWTEGASSFGQIFYIQHRVDSGWGEPTLIGQGSFPLMTVDIHGQLHLIHYVFNPNAYFPPAALYYRTLPANAATWSPATRLFEELVTYHGLAATSDGTVHLWIILPGEGDKKSLGYLTFPVTKPMPVLKSAQLLVEANDFVELITWVGSDNTVYGYLSASPSPYYLEKRADQLWTIELVFGNYSWRRMALDQAGTLHGFENLPGLTTDLNYRFKRPGQPWSPRQRIQPNFRTYAAPVAGDDNHLYLFTEDGDVVESQIQPTTTVQAISQQVTIPADMHRPTLAFFAFLQGQVNGRSNLQVTVSDSVTTTTMLSLTTGSTWNHHWVDLTPWQGEAITVTFRGEQAAGETAFYAYVDDISLGAWETPVVKALEPAQVATGVATTIVISGENFLATPTIQLGEHTLNQVRRLDDTRLEVTIPASLPPGIYNLQISNPGGATSHRPSALSVGVQIFAPIIHQGLR